MSGKSTFHVAIILDGNGRWAAERGLPRLEGHRQGAAAVRRTVEAAARGPVSTLSVYAFSSDNWRRPREEVSGLMSLFRVFLENELARCLENGVRLSLVGRVDRLDGSLRSLVEDFERRTSGGSRLHLRIAVDYSSRDAMLRAAGSGALTRDSFALALGAADRGGGPAPDVDLLIRTGGERRLSDFLLWESAYAELLFLEKMWPDFDERDLEAAIAWFRGRQRRFGGLPEVA